MDIWEANKLILFIAFVVPGFVSLKTYELLFPGFPKEASQQLVDAVAYSSINYALLLWPIYEVEIHDTRLVYPTAYILFVVFVLFIAPILWALLLRKLRVTQLFQGALPHPTEKPWDFVFSQRNPRWVIVTLEDGQQIAGRYDSKSFASSSPATEQLYLEETWVLNDDGGFERPRSDSAGVMIVASGIVKVEFFNIMKEDENAGQEANK